jgi:hypothetical protein
MTEPAAVLQALVERLNPTTPAEAARDLVETLAGLVCQAAGRSHLYTIDLVIALRDAQVPILEAMQGMPRAAPRSAQWAYQGPDGVIDPHGAIRSASDAHSPGTGHVGVP